MRTCKFCGVSIEDKRKDALYCSSIECKKASRREWQSRYVNNHREKEELRLKRKHKQEQEDAVKRRNEQLRTNTHYTDILQFNKLKKELLRRLRTLLVRDARKERLAGKKVKKCKMCGKTMPVDEFYRDKSHSDGLDSRCKNCTAIRLGRKKLYKREMVWDKTNGLCTYCGCELDPKNWHVDHILAQSRGGSDFIDNLTPACPICNQQKSDMLVEIFRESIGR